MEGLMEENQTHYQVSHEELLASLKVLVSQACQAGNVQSEVDSEGVTVKLRFGRGPEGDFNLARNIAALLAQETM